MKNIIFVLSLLNVLYAQQENNQFTGTLKNGLIGYWPFSGNTDDASGNGNLGSVYGAKLTKDRFGNDNNAYLFDGIDDYIIVENKDILNLNTFSISFWYKEEVTSKNNASHVMISKCTTNPKEIGFWIETGLDGKNYFNLNYYFESQIGVSQPGSGYVCGTEISTSKWAHLCIVKNGPLINMYKNGINVGSNSELSRAINNENKLIFGALKTMNYSNFFLGKLDDIAVWNKALTYEEIKSIFDYSPSMNTQKIETNEDYFFSTNSSWSNKNIQDSLTKLIPSKNQKSIIKLVKDLSKVDSQKRLNSSIDNLYNYFFLQSSNQNQTIAFVREIQYFLNLTKNDINFYDYYESEITNFIDSANNYLNSRILTEFKSAIPQTESYSKLWINLLKVESYPWVKILRYEDDFDTIVYQPIVNIYFEKFKKLNGIAEQKELIDDFTIHFPKMNEDAEVIAFIFFKIDDEQCDGNFKLFNHDFFGHWVTYEGDPLQNIPWWLARNENDENEISAIYSILSDSISLWQFSLCQNNLCGIVEVHKNNQLYFQMQFEDVDSDYHSDYPNSVIVFENEKKCKEVYFNWPQWYSFYFKDGINITEKGIIDTLKIATDLTKLKEPEFEKALALVYSLKWHDFPDTLTLKVIIDSTQKEIEKLRTKDLITQVELILTETDILMSNNQFQEGRDKLVEAEKIAAKLKIQDQKTSNDHSKNYKNNQLTKLSDENLIFKHTSLDIKNKREELINKEIKFLEMSDRNKIQEILTQGEKLKLEKLYSQAIAIYDKTIFEYQTKQYPEIQTMKDELVVLNKLLQDDLEANRIKIIENKKIKLINELQFTTIGKVEISKNYLNVTEFTNGDPIYYARSAEEFARKTIEKIPVYCFYNFEERYSEKGIYYNIYALHDPTGRKLFPDEFRLPFQSEIVYMYDLSRKIESKKSSTLQKEFISYILNPNEIENCNGYNMLEYENSTFNFYQGKYEPSKLKEPYRAFGKFGLNDYPDDMRHMFWVIPDFDFNDWECTVSPNFFSCDFQNPSQTEHATYSICEIAKKRNYYNDEDVVFSNRTPMKDLNPSMTKKQEFTLVASQVKLVKQRPILRADDWLSNSTSKKLIKKKYDYSNGVKIETITYPIIEVATNEYQWREYNNKQIPACMSNKFDTKNDSLNGLLYNSFCFSDKTLPFVKNARPMDLFELSNTKYKIEGDELAFWNYLMEELKLNQVAFSSWDDKITKQLFYEVNRGNYMYTDNFAVNRISLNRYSNDNEFFICSFSRNDYSKELNLFFSTNAFPNYSNDDFIGNSIRYLKK
jgi:hypothetical protein